MTRCLRFLFITLFVVAACGGSGPSGPGEPPDDPVPPSNDGIADVGPTGGTVSLDDQAIARIPSGALSSEVTIEISSATAPSPLVERGAFGPAYRFRPEGLGFGEPVEVEIFVPDQALAGRDLADVHLVSTGPAGPEELANVRRSTVAGGARVIGTTTHFSIISPAVTPNRAPSIDIGEDRNAAVGTAVTLAATTGDPDDDPVTVTWELASRPQGSAAGLSSSTGTSTSLDPDVAGQYRVRATATDGRGGTATDEVVVTASAVAANAGPDQSTVVGTTTTLDGRGSVGDDLTYSWRFLSTPGSTPAIQDGDRPVASFVPNAAGEYVVELTVSNDAGSSTDTARIVAAEPNRAPSVSLTGPEVVFLDTEVTFSATASDPDGDAVSLDWTLERPAGSSATLGVDGTVARLLPDAPGRYLLRVAASDGEDETVAAAALLANPDVAGTYDATSRITGGCGDGGSGDETVGELPVEQPAPDRVVLDLPTLDDRFASKPAGDLAGTEFSFDGNLDFDLEDGEPLSLPSAIRGTIDPTTLDLDLEATIILLGCTIEWKIEGTRP